MIDASGFYGPRRRRPNGSNDTLLKGSMIPKRFKTVPILVTRVRAAPTDWDARLVLDFEYRREALKMLEGSLAATASSWAVNKTNALRLRAFLSERDDFEELEGMRIRLRVVPQHDPKTGENVRSLQVVEVSKDETAKWIPYPPPTSTAEEDELEMMREY